MSYWSRLRSSISRWRKNKINIKCKNVLSELKQYDRARQFCNRDVLIWFLFLSNWKSYFHGWKSTKLIEHCKGKWNNWCLIRPTETGIDWRYNLVLSRLNFYSPFWRTSLLLLLDEKKNIGTGWEGRGGPCPAPKVCQINLSFFGWLLARSHDHWIHMQ